MTDDASTSEVRPSEAESARSNDEKLPAETRIRRFKLYRAALSGDWDMAEGIYKEYEADISVGISKGGDTALHIAAAAGHTDFVKQLVGKMSAEDLAKKNDVGNTALCLAAASGKKELAEVMMGKKQDLAMIRDSNNMLPLHMAAALGHKDTVEFLYQKTEGYLKDEDRIELLVTLIKSNLYDVALKKVFKTHLVLATARVANGETAVTKKKNGETALHALARKPLTPSSFANPNKRGILRRCFNLVLGDHKYADNKKLQADALELVKGLWKQVILLSDSEISNLIGSPWRLIFVAAEQGNIEFLSILINEYPDILWKVDEDNYSIFHLAVLNRHDDIFKLIYEIGSIKDTIVMSEDEEGNNILHLAGKLAPSNQLNIVSGAALQMQREFLWFKQVSKVVQPKYAEAENKQKLTPRALFTKEHKKLREEGEKWMKDTATSCMLVATLIATVVFAAAFTVPGGNKGDTGFPTFLQKLSFKIFAISDAISLVFSSASIVNFLSILTSRYAEEDFLKKLPRKLLIGLATLFLSIAAMMVVFSTTFFIVFKDGMEWIAIFVTVIASAPVIMFIWQHYHLFRDVLRSTYISNSLFRPGKKRLFPREGNQLTVCQKSEQLKANSPTNV